LAHGHERAAIEARAAPAHTAMSEIIREAMRRLGGRLTRDDGCDRPVGSC
jgi:hypothetical protein